MENRNKNNYKNNNNNANRNGHKKLNFELEKLHINKDDVIIIKCKDESIPNQPLINMAKRIKQSCDVKDVIIAPEEVSIETIDENSLQEIIDKLIQIRNEKWRNKLHKGE